MENQTQLPATEVKNEVAPVNNTGTALSNYKDRKGFEEEIDTRDIRLPRAKLMQALSPEVVDQAHKSGVIINDLTGDVMPIEFVPIFKFTEYVKFNPRDKKDPNYDPAFEPGAILWKTVDSNDPRVAECEFGPNGEKPTALKVLNFFCYFPEILMPAIISFSKTSYKAGKNLLSLCLLGGGAMFSRKYKLTAKQETGDAGTYFVFQVGAAGRVNEDDFKVCSSLYEQFRPKKIDVVYDEEHAPNGAASSGRPY